MKLWSEPNSSQLLKPPFFQIIQKKKKTQRVFSTQFPATLHSCVFLQVRPFYFFFFAFLFYLNQCGFGLCDCVFGFRLLVSAEVVVDSIRKIIMLKGFLCFLDGFLFIWFFFCNRNGTSNVVCRDRDGAVLQPITVDKLKLWILRDWKSSKFWIFFFCFHCWFWFVHLKVLHVRFFAPFVGESFRACLIFFFFQKIV